MSMVKFAVVREDPLVEAFLIQKYSLRDVLMVASGGCNAITLQAIFPAINTTVFDLNPDQIALMKKKINLLCDKENFQRNFNILSSNKDGLNACGEFESLFRCFRGFLNEFILDEHNILKLFLDETGAELRDKLIYNKYWRVAFELYFSDSMLITMFGNDAIQHAKFGSYPMYFQKAIENGISRKDFRSNYFLHHIMLGYYLDDKGYLPYYLANPNSIKEITYMELDIAQISNWHDYDLISLSNLFDWMDEYKSTAILGEIVKHAKSGTFIIYRQLNNEKNIYSNLLDYVEPLHSLELELLNNDRSMFYNKLNILRKR
ncbi:DUF3419 superfamily protein [Candidatus Cyrtobacter comes]|uniref:DUF3419 superfamily protein n=1 Tax=Candidatus Cyrtobacter comes TaxID=675776 RepID=A0ABU5L9L3_9RICK|nr:DUF3419 superfamily protein [Candidatus Cyrtobacter comes]